MSAAAEPVDRDGAEPSATETVSGIARRSDGLATQARILDAAEIAFATAPYDAVSLRRITGDAGVNLALVKYYFTSKEKLFETVVQRRAPALRKIRRDRLAAVLAAGDVTPEKIIDAYMGPLFDKMLSEDPGWPSYIRMLGYLVQDGRFSALIRREFDDTAGLYFEEMQKVLPEAKAENLLYGFTFLLSMMLRALSNEVRTATLAEGKIEPDDLCKLYRHLLPFCSAGLERVAQLD